MRRANSRGMKSEKQLWKRENQLEETQSEVGESQKQLEDTQNRAGDTQNEVEETRNEVGEAENQPEETQYRVGETQNGLFKTANRLFVTKNQLSKGDKKMKKITTEKHQFKKLGQMCDFGILNGNRFEPGTAGADGLTSMISTVSDLRARTASQASVENRLRELLRAKLEARLALREDVEW